MGDFAGKVVAAMSDPYYEDDHVTLYHGDCLEILPDLEFDVIVTDPPYGISDTPNPTQGRTGKRQGSANTWHPESAWDHALPNFGALPAVPSALFGHWRQRPAVEALMATPLRAEIVWAKDTHVGPPCPVAMRDERIWVFGPTGIKPRRFETSVWDERIIPTWSHRRHKNEKPLNLMLRLVSWMPDGVVCDPFAGSGATLRAAKDLNQRAVGVEMSEAHCEIAARRMGQEVLF